MRTVSASAVFAFAAISSFCPIARADEAALFACIKKYTGIGVSPDMALERCEQKSLAGCIKNLVGKEEVITSTTVVHGTIKKKGGYIIDLGDNQDLWMEGGGWRDKGCDPVASGPSKTTRIGDPWNGEVKLEWFRQGLCPSSEYKTGATYSIEKAEKICKLQAVKSLD